MNIRLRLPFREDAFFSTLTLLVLTVPLVFFMFTFEKYETIKLALWYILLGAALLVLLFQNWKEKIIHPWRTHIGLCILAGFLEVCVIVSSIVGLDLHSSLFGYVPRYTGSVLMLTAWLLTLIFLLLRLTRDRMLFLLRVALFTAVLGAIVAIMQSFGIAFYEGPGSGGVLLRAPGLLGNANFSSMYIAALLPCAVVFFFQSTHPRPRIYYGLAAILMVIGVIVLSSRGAVLGLVGEQLVFIVLWGAFRMGKKQLLGVVLLLITTFGLWYGTISRTRPTTIQQTFQLNEENINLRFYVWDIARQAMTRYPIFGVGPSNFQIYFEQKRDPSLASQNGIYDDAHNLFLHLGATVGNLFLLGFIVLIACGIFFGFRQLRDRRDPVALALIAGLAGFLIIACFTPVPSSCYLLLALYLACLYFYNSKESSQFSFRYFRIPLGLLAITAVAWGVTFFAGEFLFFQAYNNYLAGRIAQSFRQVKLAIRLHPVNQLFYIYEAGDLAKAHAPVKLLQEKVNGFIALHPNDAHSYTAAANVYFAAYVQNHDKQYLEFAIASIQDSLDRDRFYAHHYTQIALYYFADNSLSNAMDYLKFGLSLDKDNVPGWLLLARLYQIQGKAAPMLASLREIHAMHPELGQLAALLQKAQGEQDIQNITIPIGIVDGSLE